MTYPAEDPLYRRAEHLRGLLVRLLDDGRIPFTKTGKHRRVQMEDVLAFKEKRDRERRLGLDELTQMSEEFGGYDELK